MAEDYTALIQAKLQTDELEAQLKEIQNRKIELDIEVKSSKNAAQQLNDSINKGLKSVKLESLDLSKQLASAFNITDKSVIKQIQSQLNSIMTNLANTWDGAKLDLSSADWLDSAFSQLADTITQNANVIQSKMGIYDEFFNYFKNKKIYISDELKNAFNVDEYKELLQNNIGSIVRDATKGISIDSIWGEMTDLFPEYFSKDVINEVDQITQAFALLKKAREDVTKSVSASDLSAEDLVGLSEDSYSKVYETIQNIGNLLQTSIQTASESAKTTFDLNVNIDTAKIISDIQNAFKTASSSLGDALDIQLNINEDEIVTAVRNAIDRVITGDDPVEITVQVNKQSLQDDLNAALTGMDLPISFNIDAAQLESEIRAALASITDISIDLHVDTGDLVDISNTVDNYLDDFELDFVNADALVQNIDNINVSGKRGKSIFQSFGDSLNSAFSTYTVANLLTDAIRELINVGKEAIETVVEIDTSMTQLEIVTGATSSELESFLDTSISLAKELGQSVTDVVDSITDFSRLGYELEDASNLASYASILSNTAAVTTDEATTGLTSIIAGYSLSVEQAEHVADSLISVGNGYAVSASELIEAYEKAGAALSASGTSFEQSAGLIAAANSATQNASRVGTALATVSARIRSATTEGQEELETLGEDVSDLSEGFSKYAEELQSLTGFSILEEGTTDTYKSIYDIFEGISKVWDDLSDTSQSRVAEILGGNRQYSVISSLLNNFSDAAGAYTDAMNSAGTATAANETYMQSLQARIDALSASLQSLANDTIPTELYGQLIDCATAVVDFANETQILKAALIGIGTSGTIALFQKIASGAGEAVTEFSNLSNAISLLKTGDVTNSFEALLQMTSGLSQSQTNLILSSTSLSDAQRVAILMNQGMSQAEAQATLSAMGLATAEGTATATTTSFSSALKGLWATLLANPLVLVAAGVTAVVTAYSAYSKSVKQAREDSQEAAEAWGESNDSLASYRERIEELRTSLDSDTLSEEDAYEAKSELLSIQQSLSESYGDQADGISLVNGALQEQLDLIDDLSVADAKTYLKDNADQIEKATKKIEGFEYSLGTYYSGTENGDAIEGIISQYSDYFDKRYTWDGGIELYFDANAEDAESVLSDFKLQILDLQESTGDDSFLNGFYSNANSAIESASNVLDKWQTIYDEAQEAQIIADTGKYEFGGTEQTAAKWMKDYAAAVEAYNEALATGDSEEIEAAKTAYESLDEAMDYLVENTGMSDYADDVSDISAELDTATIAANNFEDALQGIDIEDNSELAISQFAQVIKDQNLTDIDFKIKVAENEGDADSIFTKIVTYAEEAGLSVDELTTMLVDLGIVAGEVSTETAEATEAASITFASLFTDDEGEATEFSESIDDFQTDIESISETLDSLHSGEDIDFADLVQEFPELAGQADNLEEALTNLSAAKLEEFAETWKTATADLEGDELEAASQYFNELIKSLDFSDYDFSGVYDSLYTQLMSGHMDSGHAKALTDQLFEEFGGTSEGLEAILKLTLNPDSANWTYEEWVANIEDQEVSIQLSASTENVEKLSSALDALESEADLLESEQSLKQAMGESLTADDYKALIKNSEEQIANLEEQNAELGTQKKLLREAGEDYSDVESQIDENTIAINSAKESQIEWNKAALTLSYDNAIASIDAVTDALNAQTTGVSVDYDAFSSDELKDYQSALEYVNGSLQLNRAKVEEITEAKVAEAKATNEATKAQKQADYAANAKEIQDLTKSLSECDETSDEYADTLAQIQKLQSDNSAISSEITQLDLLNASLDESISKYQKWQDSLNASESGDMFDDMKDMLQAIKDVNDVESEDYGKVGTQKYQAAVDFVVPDTIDKADQDAVYNYLQEIEKYMTFDDSGDYEGLNLSQFITDAVDQGLMYLDETDNSYKIAGEQTMQAFADGMGLSLETVQAIFGELEEYLPEGSEFVWSDGTESLEDMAVSAGEAATALQQLEGYDDFSITMDVSDIEDTETKISTLEATIQQMEDLKAQPEIDASQIENANTIIEYCQAQIDALNSTDSNVDVTADTSDADSGMAEVNETEIEDKTTTITADDQASSVIQSIINLLSRVRSKSVTITTNHVTTTSGGAESVTGTAYASGTAKASGDWGTKKSGRTLVGELGREIVVNPYTGRWYTVGDNGAEFVDIPKGSIVFDHLQSESLLSDGYVASRGLALAGGTAFAGSSTVSGGGIKVTTVTNQSGSTSTTTTTATTTSSSGSSSSSKSSSSSSDEETALEKFQDWFSSLFDWIEIKLEYMTNKINKYVSKAENALEAGKYSASTRNYKKAIKSTSKQIDNESEAASKYSTEAEKVLEKAQSMGVVTASEISEIKSKVSQGTMVIDEYSEEIQDVISSYQEWNSKSEEAQEAIENITSDLLSYVDALKEVSDAQRDAKIDSIETTLEAVTASNAYTVSEKNDQLSYTNTSLKKEQKAYATATANQEKLTTERASTATDAVKSALKTDDAKNNEKYNTALKNAKKAINAEEQVSDSDLKTIKEYSASVYAELSAWNAQVKNLETARNEEAVFYATSTSEIYSNIAQKYENKDENSENKISQYESQSSLADSAEKANSYLDKALAQYQKIVSNDQAEIDTYKAKMTTAQNTITSGAAGANYSSASAEVRKKIKALLKEIRSAVKAEKEIDSDLLADVLKYQKEGYVVSGFWEACVDWNNALSYKESAEANKIVDEATLAEMEEAYALEKLQNIEDEYENDLSVAQSKTSVIKAEQSKKTASGASLDSSDYADLVNASQKEEAIMQQEYDAIISYMEGLDSSSDVYKTAAVKANELAASIAECQAEQIEYNNALLNLPIDTLNEVLDVLSSVSSYYKALLGYQESTGRLLTAGDYWESWNAATVQAGEALALAQTYNNYLQEAWAKDGTYAGQTAAYWQEAYYDAMADYESFLDEAQEATNSMVQVPYNTVDDILDAIEAYDGLVTAINSLKETKGYDLGLSDYSLELDSISQQITEIAVKQQQAWSDYQTAVANGNYYGGKTANEWLTMYYEFTEELTDLEEQVEEINNAIAQMPYDTIEQTLELLEAVADYNVALADLKETIGENLDASDYLKQISDLNDQIAQLSAEQVQAQLDYEKALANGGVYGGKSSDEWLTEYYEYSTSLTDLQQQVEELYNTIAQLPYDEIEAIIDLLETTADYHESVSNLKTTLGEDLSVDDYMTQIDDIKDQIEQYEAAYSQAISDANLADASGGYYGGLSTDEWLQKAEEYLTTINDLNVDIEDLKDALRDDVFWRTFERAHEASERLLSVLSGISDLITDDMYFDSDGNMTKYGIAQLSNLSKQYDEARVQVQNYSDDIDNLNDLYEEGWYTEEEYTEKLNELQTEMLEAAGDAQSAINSVIDIFQEQSQEELDALTDLIDSYEDALNAKADYYSYDKSIKDKTKSIQALEQEISALTGVEDAASKAKLASLTAELQEQQEELDELVFEHEIELSTDALDALKESLQDSFETYWSDISSNLTEITSLMSAANSLTESSTESIVSTLNELLAFYGIDSVSTGVLNATQYASGTKSLQGDQLTLTQEEGSEAIVLPDGTILSELPNGSTIFNADQTGNLQDWSNFNPADMVSTVPMIDLSQIDLKPAHSEVNFYYDNPFTVQGNVTKDALPDLQTILKESYTYTSKQIRNDLKKAGY
ncbi:MAG: phage tail tape measure protein [Lachnospiraceae bacterium]|nr:phage tail tape measure protein [Lachnospiraceae bacterium]